MEFERQEGGDVGGAKRRKDGGNSHLRSRVRKNMQSFSYGGWIGLSCDPGLYLFRFSLK